MGTYLPERILTNPELEQMVDTSDEWIIRRTGIKTRHIAADDQATSDLCIPAAREALESASMAPEDLDMLIVATLTPDYMMPATACIVQDAIGAVNATGFDLEAACSGFVYGISCAAAMVASGLSRNVLVIGAETLSRMTDYTDRGSCILFGDGAGAALLQPPRNGGELIYTEMGCDGSQPDLLNVPAGGTRWPTCHKSVNSGGHYIHLRGRDVFKYAVTKLGELLQRLPERTGISPDDIKLVVPHQSNMRIVRAAFERIGLDPTRAYMNIERVGNTSAASIPIALAEAIGEGLLDRGDLVLLLAFGGGLTWGCTLLRY